MQQTPTQGIENLQEQHDKLVARLHKAMHERLLHKQQQLSVLTHNLDTISPLATLGRGYTLVQRSANDEILRDASNVKVGEEIETRLAKGKLICRVESTKNN